MKSFLLILTDREKCDDPICHDMEKQSLVLAGLPSPLLRQVWPHITNRTQPVGLDGSVVTNVSPTQTSGDGCLSACSRSGRSGLLGDRQPRQGGKRPATERVTGMGRGMLVPGQVSFHFLRWYYDMTHRKFGQPPQCSCAVLGEDWCGGPRAGGAVTFPEGRMAGIDMGKGEGPGVEIGIVANIAR